MFDTIYVDYIFVEPCPVKAIQDSFLKNTTHTHVSEKHTWQEQAKLRLKEGVLILLAVLCIYLWMVLLTFDVNDSSFSNSTGDMHTVSNAGGYVGSWIADVLFSALGYFAWLFPLVLGLKTVLVLSYCLLV